MVRWTNDNDNDDGSIGVWFYGLLKKNLIYVFEFDTRRYTHDFNAPLKYKLAFMRIANHKSIQIFCIIIN